MALRVTFELEDKDLKFFRSSMRKAQEASKKTSEAEIITAAQAMIVEVANQSVPQFVRHRLDKLTALIDMLHDEEWSLETQERKNVVAALAYFADPEDLIPDSVPVLGYIDDAIMIELVVKELEHEIEAFADFCRFREEETARERGTNISHEDWVEAKRRSLHARMRRRRSARRGASARRSTRFRLF